MIAYSMRTTHRIRYCVPRFPRSRTPSSSRNSIRPAGPAGVRPQARPAGRRAVRRADQHADADTVIGDTGRLTLVTEIHLVALALIVVLAALALRNWWRTESALPVEYPNW